MTNPKVLFYGKDIVFDEKLAPYAQASYDNDGATRRIYGNNDESNDPRIPYQHDRDRIIHSKAFRRLMHKTQVFTTTKGDHYRTRLTHTMEVMQIARQIARNFRLNEDLTEAIALGHDLGHTPFGHIGERTLHEIISGKVFPEVTYYGGFKHNFQSLHIVDNLENHYEPKHPGLDLTFAVREGIIKHTGCSITINKKDDKGKITREKEQIHYSNLNLEGIELGKPSFSLEGQAVAVADEIAQRTHDLDDGFRAKFIKIEDIKNELFIKRVLDTGYLTKEEIQNLGNDHYPLIREMIRTLIEDVLKETEKKLTRKILKNEIKDNYFEERIVWFSNDIDKEQEALQETITETVINSQEVCCMDFRALKLISDLFNAYFVGPQQLPDNVLRQYFKATQGNFKRKDINKNISIMQKDPAFIRLICDHISLMTDQFAFKEYNKLFLPEGL